MIKYRRRPFIMTRETCTQSTNNRWKNHHPSVLYKYDILSAEELSRSKEGIATTFLKIEYTRCIVYQL